MDTEINQKTYELAYHLLATLEESAASLQAQEIEKFITEKGGTIVVVNQPEKIRLSYAIQHQKSAYFGVINFRTSPTMIADLNAQLKLNSNVLRYLILNKEGQPETSLSSQPTGGTDTATNSTAKTAPVDQQKIEAAIDDVLGKINY